MKHSIDSFFAPHGVLSLHAPQYEHRASQLKLAQHIAHTCEQGGTLVAEAGTGCGKTWAYLVPAILSGKKVLISTANKHLQDQIAHKDLPLVEKALGTPCDWHILKGRLNYVCHKKAASYIAHQPLFTHEDPSFQAFIQWKNNTAIGDCNTFAHWQEHDTRWAQVTASADQCTGSACPDFERCFVTQARRKAMASQILIVNHHVLFSDLKLKQSNPENTSLLPHYDILIIDEAHSIDELAATYFGSQVSDQRIQELRAEAALHAHALQGLQAKSLQNALHTLQETCELFFGSFQASEPRIELAKAFADATVERTYIQLQAALKNVETLLNTSEHNECMQLAKKTALLIDELAFICARTTPASLTQETTFTHAQNDVFVRYVECTEQRTLYAKPVHVASLLGHILQKHTCVLLSATLQNSRGFDFYLQKTGLQNASTLHVPSPFRFSEQARLYITPTPLESTQGETFEAHAVEETTQLVHAARGGAFVLCTSHRMLQRFKLALSQLPYMLLVQGSAPKELLIQQFKDHGNAVLVGSMAFWQGVDIQGSALRLVVIDKIPFAAPTDPVMEARASFLKAQNQDPFREYQLPHAAMLLKQGFGRLIRHSTDKGVVAVLDPRLKYKSYGSFLRHSLPNCPVLFKISEVQDFFNTSPSERGFRILRHKKSP